MTSYQKASISTGVSLAKGRAWKSQCWIIALAIGLVFAFVMSLATGALSIPFVDVVSLLLSYLGFDNTLSLTTAQVIESIRLPRAVLGLLVGSALAVSGATIQGVFRNPLADPALIGVSGGAALAAVAVVVFGQSFIAYLPPWLQSYALLFAAFIGSLVVTLLVARIATSSLGMSISTLLLAGIAIGIITMSGVGVITYFADDTQLRTLTFWQMGSLGGSTWGVVMAAASLIVPACLLMMRYSSRLNAMLLGEAEAGHLGVDVQSVRFHLISLSAMAVGVAVAISGMIGFVGLVIPHLVRMTLGPDHRYLLPASALAGALFLLVADMIARTFLAPAEIPIGLVTAIIGGPFFIGLIIYRGQHGAL
ncbi:FecCD family ABC transporter permease [Neptunomonas sp.]|uniref:FecCD family ABC transporter permease n=1 Tax=Neptunomonas TaxID=75687 RepID=UPI0035117332